MSDSTNDRKIQHIRIIESDRDADRNKHYFDGIRLRHRALPELALDEVDPSIEFMGRKLSFPLLISSMTGGDHELVRTVNRNLAKAAEETGVAMGVGSQRVMFDNPAARASFEIRAYAPRALLFANLGAVQLNYGFGVRECREAVAAVGADALVLHVNPLQEAVQPEGNTRFSGLADRISEVTGQLDCPVVVKEVGAGISVPDVELLIRAGVRYVDVAGTGGTSWSRIEHHRSRPAPGEAARPGEPSDETLGLVFQDWGIPTPLALQLLGPYRDRVTLIASGGVRTGIDMAKGMILGASLCGLASPFLKPAMDSSEAVIRVIHRLGREFRTAMFLLGAKDVKSLIGNGSLILP